MYNVTVFNSQDQSYYICQPNIPSYNQALAIIISLSLTNNDCLFCLSLVPPDAGKYPINYYGHQYFINGIEISPREVPLEKNNDFYLLQANRRKTAEQSYNVIRNISNPIYRIVDMVYSSIDNGMIYTTEDNVVVSHYPLFDNVYLVFNYIQRHYNPNNLYGIQIFNNNVWVDFSYFMGNRPVTLEFIESYGKNYIIDNVKAICDNTRGEIIVDGKVQKLKSVISLTATKSPFPDGYINVFNKEIDDLRSVVSRADILNPNEVIKIKELISNLENVIKDLRK